MWKKNNNPFLILTYIWLIPTTFLLTGTFFYTLAKSTRFTLYDDIDQQYTTSDHRLLLFATVVFAVLLMRWFYNNVLDRVKERWLSSAPLVVCAIVSCYLIFAVRGLPTNDARMIDDIINQFMAGDYSNLTQKGSYLCVYAFQLGYVLYGQLMHLLFGPSNFTAYQLVNLGCILLILYILYMITREIFGDTATSKLESVLACGLLFLFVYATFVYNDIPSLALQTGALFLAIRYLKAHRVLAGIGAGICIGAAGTLKNNAYIALVAMGIILLLDAGWLFFLQKQRRLAARGLAICILAVVAGIGTPRLVQLGYATYLGIPLSEMPQGVPFSTYFAMAIQDNGYGQAGWYDGYNVHVFAEHDYDREKTDREAKARFREDFHLLTQDPGHMACFYGKKYLTQWADSSFGCMRELELTSRHVEGHSALVNSIIYGNGRDLLSGLMDVHLVICYAGSALYCFFTIHDRLKKKERQKEDDTGFLLQMFILLYIFGGMLFHEVWEGSSRYTMRYSIFFVLFAARGWVLLFRSRRLPADHQE